MFEGQQISYAQVEKQLSILLIISKKPSLTQIASALNVSPFDFQRIRAEWSGVD